MLSSSPVLHHNHAVLCYTVYLLHYRIILRLSYVVFVLRFSYALDASMMICIVLVLTYTPICPTSITKHTDIETRLQKVDLQKLQ